MADGAQRREPCFRIDVDDAKKVKCRKRSKRLDSCRADIHKILPETNVKYNTSYPLFDIEASQNRGLARILSWHPYEQQHW